MVEQKQMDKRKSQVSTSSGITGSCRRNMEQQDQREPIHPKVNSAVHMLTCCLTHLHRYTVHTPYTVLYLLYQ